MWRLLLTRPGFRYLYLGDLVSMIGDWFTYVAVSVLALDQGQGLWAVAGVLLAHTLPKTLLSPAAGWLADRMDRRALLCWASILRGIMVLGMLAAASAESLWGVQALLWARMGVGAFVDASAYAILPRVVAPHELPKANALANATWSFVFGAGVALGGFVTAWAGVTAALLVDMCTFFTAALLFWQIGPVVPSPEEQSTHPTSHPSPATPPASPWTSSLLWTALGKAPASMANGVGWMMLHVAADLSLTETAALLGFFHTLRAVGTGIGPVWWAKSARLQKAAFSLSNLLTFAGVALFIVTPDSLSATITGSLLWGIGLGINWVCVTTRLQALGPDAIMGRLMSLDLASYTLAQCLGGLLVAALADAWNPWLAAWFALGLSILSWAALAWVGSRIHKQRALPLPLSQS